MGDNEVPAHCSIPPAPEPLSEVRRGDTMFTLIEHARLQRRVVPTPGRRRFHRGYPFRAPFSTARGGLALGKAATPVTSQALTSTTGCSSPAQHWPITTHGSGPVISGCGAATPSPCHPPATLTIRRAAGSSSGNATIRTSWPGSGSREGSQCARGGMLSTRSQLHREHGTRPGSAKHRGHDHHQPGT